MSGKHHYLWNETTPRRTASRACSAPIRGWDRMAHVLEAVARSDLALEIEFIDGETLHRWRDLIVDVVDHPPDWERFRYVASRHLREAGIETPEQFEEFLRSLPDLVDETLRYLTEARVREFMGSAVQGSVTAVKEYLECA